MSELNKVIIPRRGKFPIELKNKAVELSKVGKTTREISQFMGIAKSTIYDWTKHRIRKKNLESIKRSLSTEKNECNLVGESVAGESSASRLAGFKELKIIQRSCADRKPPNSEVAMIQVYSPDGFKILIPSSEEKILSLFFKERSTC